METVIFFCPIAVSGDRLKAFQKAEYHQASHGYNSRYSMVKEGKMAEKAVYTLTEAGEQEFEKLMLEIASGPIHIFLDFNAVIVNLTSLPQEKQQECLNRIESNVKILKAYLEENIDRKGNAPGIPETGMAVLQQQYILAEAIEAWITSLNESMEK